MKQDLTLPGNRLIPGADIKAEYSRSSGPGGQHVNKTSSRVTLRLSLATCAGLSDEDRKYLLRRLAPRLTQAQEILVSCSTHRDRLRNEEDALERLRSMLVAGLQRPKKRRPTRPTKGSVERRLSSKRQAGQRKQRRKPPRLDQD